MPKYRVSLACKVPTNYECIIEADNELEAQNKAIEKYENGDFGDEGDDNGYIAEPDYGEIELDLGNHADSEGIFGGAWIEERD